MTSILALSHVPQAPGASDCAFAPLGHPGVPPGAPPSAGAHAGPVIGPCRGTEGLPACPEPSHARPTSHMPGTRPMCGGPDI